ncbi:MAG: hypothetical protein NTX25_18610 [Proteobacteria bacterium]|nr:hypothetical protein [Pseudomonadota bacterium]
MSNQNSKEMNLKGPDAFQAKLAEFFAGIAQNPKPLLGVVTAILVVLLAGFGFRYFSKNKQDARRTELSQVDQGFEDEAKAFTKQREALEKKRDTLKAAQVKPAADPKDAKPLEDSAEIKALDAEIKSLKPNHSASALQYKNFFAHYPKAAEGWVAGLKYAAYAAEQGQLEEAQNLLEQLVKNSNGHAVLQTQTLFLLISVLEDRNEFDKALEQIEVLNKIASDELKPRILLGKAQIFFFKKDYANTKVTATKLLTEHESSPEADRARSLLALLPD